MPRAAACALTLSFLVILAPPAAAAWIRPVEGGGNFASTVDLANFRRPDGRLDVVVMVAIDNRELTFERRGGRWRGEVTAAATLTSADGVVIAVDRKVPISARGEQDAQSATLAQIFTLVLRDVPFNNGVFRLDLRDQNRNRPIMFSFLTKEKAFSQADADWAAPPAPADRGLAVGDPIFLAHAPIAQWSRTGMRPEPAQDGGPWDYLHPLRRYGLEQDSVQLYFDLAPARLPAARRDAASRDLLIEVLSKDLDFALRDTLRLTAAVREALAAGRTAAVYHQLDARLLPPGSFRLGIVPLDTAGTGVLAEFDVTWRLDQIARDRNQLTGEGRVVFSGDRLDEFLAATRMEQQVKLEEFWHSLDPDPSDPQNEVYAEFRRRVAYADQNLGGFGTGGARDDRGYIYILLGPADEVTTEVVPLNQDDLEDARIKVYQPYAPERIGTWAKGSDPSSSQGQSPYNRQGGIPMPYSRAADQDILQNKTSPTRDHAYELWRYVRGGNSLFPNQYSDNTRVQGMQFLFVDQDGAGHYRLSSSNAHNVGD